MVTVAIAEYLAQLNIAPFSEEGESKIFIEHVPPTGEFIISLFNSPGEEPDVKTNLERPGLQVLVKGNNNPKDSYNFALEVYRALHKAKDINTADGLVLLVRARNSMPEFLECDDNGNYVYTMNYTMIMEV